MTFIKHPHSPEFGIKQIDELIAQHEHIIALLKEKRKIFELAPPMYIFESAPKLTKDYIRDYMKIQTRPVQTVEVIGVLFSGISKEDRNKAIKTLSVIFNTLEKDGQIKIEKKPGTKGNFYSWIQK